MHSKDIYAILATLNDPELGIDIVSLGLIYDISLAGTTVNILMTLTTPGCPLAPYFEKEVPRLVGEVEGVEDVRLTFTFDPPWSPERMAPSARIQLTMPRH